MQTSRQEITNYREYLQAIQERRNLKQFEFARLVGRSPAWLSQILNGRRQLQPQLAEEIAERLELTSRQRLELLSLVEREVGNSSLIRGRAADLLTGLAKPEPGDVTEPSFRQQLGEWHLGAVLELARCVDYQPDPSWVAATLRPRISTEDAERAMNILRENGYMNDEYRLTHQDPNAGTPRQVEKRNKAENVSATRYHQETLSLAQKAILGAYHEERLFAAASIALSENDFQKFKARLQEMFAQSVYSAAQEPPNRIYHVNLAVFPLSLYSDNSLDPRMLQEDE